MAKREFSSGGIVFKYLKQELRILLIKDYYGHWTYPKGHIQPGESSVQAALREITEETGLQDLAIIGKVGRNNYFFRLSAELIFKTVDFFLIEAEGQEKIVVQKNEIEAARWFKPQAALKKVDYKGAEEMLKKAIKIYEQKKGKKCSE